MRRGDLPLEHGSIDWPEHWKMQREHPLHEPPFYWIMGLTKKQSDLAWSHGFECAGWRRDQIVKRGNRLVRLLAKEGQSL